MFNCSMWETVDLIFEGLLSLIFLNIFKHSTNVQLSSSIQPNIDNILLYVLMSHDI